MSPDGVSRARRADGRVRALPALAQAPELQRVLRAPADPEASFELARAAAQAGDFATSITALERLLLLQPGLDNIRLELGILYLRTGATEAGERLIRDALKNPDVPAEVRARAGGFLAAAETANDPLQVEGSVTLGLISQSNANSAPGSLADLGFRIDPASEGRSDIAAFLRGQVALRYDLGVQAGHRLALDAGLYVLRHGDLTEIDFDRLSLSPGIDLNLSRAFGRGAELSFRLDASRARRDGERFVTEIGPSATLRLVTGERSSARVGAFWRDQAFEPTSRVTVNDERDGEVFGLFARGDRRLGERASLSFGIAAQRKTARAPYEAYDRATLTAGYVRSVDAPLGDGAPWIIALNGSLSRSLYDGPDPVIDPVDARDDTALTIAGGVTVPLGERVALQSEVGRTVQSSSYATNDYDNTFASIAFSVSF